VELQAADGVILRGAYYQAVDASAPVPALLILHSSHENRTVWHGFAKSAQALGYGVLAMDLRGHGKSEGVQTFTPELDKDIDLAMLWLLNHPSVDGNRVGILGSSVGASLSLRAGARFPWVRAIAMISPGRMLWEITIDEAILPYGDRPIMLVAATTDEYHAATARYIHKEAQGFRQLQMYEGDGHGEELFKEHPDLEKRLLNFFQSNLMGVFKTGWEYTEGRKGTPLRDQLILNTPKSNEYIKNPSLLPS
jgi:pimeloyl-ACP methyl ester carboxylesterase